MKFIGVKSIGVMWHDNVYSVCVVHVRGVWFGEFKKVEVSMFDDNDRLVVVDKMPMKISVYDVRKVSVYEDGSVVVIL